MPDMKPVILTFFFYVAGLLFPADSLAQAFDRSAFYTVVAGNSLADMDAQLNVLSNSSIPEKEAYEGVLLMKKAGVVSGLKNKLNQFKAGRRKLEAALAKDNNNPEFRFLRLMIQENAPGILNYNDQLEEDSQFVGKHFTRLSPVVKKAVTAYSKSSKILQPELL